MLHCGDPEHLGQRDRMFDIADVAFAKVPEEEKKQFTANFKETGLYSGYKLRQYWVSNVRSLLRGYWDRYCMQHIDNGVRDQIEHFNGKYDGFERLRDFTRLDPYSQPPNLWSGYLPQGAATVPPRNACVYRVQPL